MSDSEMREEYDFSASRRNPYVKQLKKAVTIRLETTTVDYFKEVAGETGIPYQTLINLFLAECAREHKRPAIRWE